MRTLSRNVEPKINFLGSSWRCYESSLQHPAEGLIRGLNCMLYDPDWAMELHRGLVAVGENLRVLGNMHAATTIKSLQNK